MEREGRIGRAQDFQANENILYDPIMIDTCYTFI